MPELMPHRVQHFKANCLAWAALYHFLPANLLRELSYVLDWLTPSEMDKSGLISSFRKLVGGRKV